VAGKNWLSSATRGLVAGGSVRQRADWHKLLNFFNKLLAIVFAARKNDMPLVHESAMESMAHSGTVDTIATSTNTVP
jgi:hypothetical protein